MRQLGHYETIEKMPQVSLDCVLYVCGISSENLGLILRSADVFGVSAIYYHGRQHDDTANSKQLSKLSRNSSVPVYFVDELEALIKLKNSGYEIVALEITDTSVPLRMFPLKQKTCLVVGNEKNGVPEDILDLADCACHIEMTGGHISSLNVSVATSIALYEITRKLFEE